MITMFAETLPHHVQLYITRATTWKEAVGLAEEIEQITARRYAKTSGHQPQFKTDGKDAVLAPR